MRFLTLTEVLDLYLRLMAQSGGAVGLRDLNALESALAQPRQSFGGMDLYPTLPEKAAALCFSLIQNHPFIDGNKRIGHAAMETFLILNQFEITAPVGEQDEVIHGVASGTIDRKRLIYWLESHIREVVE